MIKRHLGMASCVVVTLLAATQLNANEPEHGLSPSSLQLGGIYAVSDQRIVFTVAELLERVPLRSTDAWIEHQPLDEPHSQLLGLARRRVCINGCWKDVEYRVEVQATAGTISRVRGLHELPDILNRPILGDLSTRSSDIRIAQLRQQVSGSLSDCGENEHLTVCVMIKRLENPELLLQGYQSEQEATGVANRLAGRMGLTVRQLEETDEGSFRAGLEGIVICASEFRIIRDTEPRFGRERLFYLDGHERAEIRAQEPTAQLILR